MATYTVRNSRGVRTVTTERSGQQALAILRGAADSFSRSLVRQWDERGHLSESQWSWVHVLAEERYQSLQAAPPAPAPAPAPPVDVDTDEVRRTAALTVRHETGRAVRQTTCTASATDDGERMIRTLEATVGLVDQDYVLINYDIPTRLQTQVGNPSRLLWHFGFRMTLSVWVVPTRHLKARAMQDLFSHWRRFNIKYFIVPQDPRVRGVMKNMARERLTEEIQRQHTSLIENLSAAEKRLAEAMEKATTPKNRDKSQAAHDNGVRALLKRAAEDFEAAVKCAEAFEETESVSDLLDGLRAALRSQAASFNARMRAEAKPVAKVNV